MNRFACFYFALLTLTQLGVSTVFAEEDSLDDWKIQKITMTESLGTHTQISIENQFGDVRVKTSSDNEILFFGVYQFRTEFPIEPEIRFVTDEEVLKISVEYPSLSKGESLEFKGRTDIAVITPKHIPLQIITDDGSVQAKGHTNTTAIRTQSGPILMVSNGSIDVESADGNIQVTFQNTEGITQSKVVTTTGDIRTQFVNDADMQINLSTAGSITTDYSLDIDSFEGTSYKEASASVGSATNQLDIMSQLGSISLTRIYGFISPENVTDNNVE